MGNTHVFSPVYSRAFNLGVDTMKTYSTTIKRAGLVIPLKVDYEGTGFGCYITDVRDVDGEYFDLTLTEGVEITKNIILNSVLKGRSKPKTEPNHE